MVEAQMKSKSKPNKSITFDVLFLFIISFLCVSLAHAQAKQTVTAIYIPLADHYAGIVAYEKYRDKMPLPMRVLQRRPQPNDMCQSPAMDMIARGRIEK